MNLQALFKRFLKKEGRLLHDAVADISGPVDEEMDRIRQRIEAKKTKRKKLQLLLGGLSFLVIIFAVVAIYSQYQLRTLTRDELQAEIPLDKQARTGEEIVKALGRLVVLPEGEPQIAEVQDAARLKATQAFFENAENGDVVVVYDSTIYLYRPSKDVLVSFGEISALNR